MSDTSARKSTIVDVARLANVSAGTVSNALTGKRPVAESTRQRILEAVETLGYQPNLLAQGLVNKSSKILGVVASGLEYYGPSRTLVGIENAANALGYSVLLDLLHSPVSDDVNSTLNVLTARRVDGIIWAVHEIGDNRAWVSRDRLRSLPPIVFLTMEPRPNIAVVSSDNRSGARSAAGHLLDQGRRVIGHITGPQDWWEARERQQGWREALLARGYEPAPDLVAMGNWSAASGEQGLYDLLERRPDIDAIFASNDQTALGALRAAHLLGRQVPDDLAVVGFDNIPESAYFWPPLTTVRQRLIDLGRTAVEVLQQAIEAKAGGEEEEQAVLLTQEPELIVRASTVGEQGRSPL